MTISNPTEQIGRIGRRTCNRCHGRRLMHRWSFGVHPETGVSLPAKAERQEDGTKTYSNGTKAMVLCRCINRAQGAPPNNRRARRRMLSEKRREAKHGTA